MPDDDASTENLPPRRDVEHALRAAGLSNRQARKFVSAGWRALVSETEAELEDVKALLEDVTCKVRDNAAE